MSEQELPLFTELTAPSGVKWNQPLGLFINNEFVKSNDDKEITRVYAADSADVDEAVKAARAAFENPEWSDLAPTDRGALLYKLADLVEKSLTVLSTLDTWDAGKPITVTKTEDCVESINTLRYYAGWADKVTGKTIDVGPSKLVYTLHQPIVDKLSHGIIPMAAWKLGPALATGNTVVLKSAEQSPLSALFLAQLIKEAGFPAGVVNIVSGFGKTAGAAIASHEGIDKVAFTGSTFTGRAVMKAASVNLKNITIETGGKSPLVIFGDADTEQAVKWAHIGIMSNSGQFIDHTTKTSVVGDPFDEDTSHGPQVSKLQFERVMEYVERGKAEGAKLVLGGTTPGTNLISPTVFADVEDHHTISQEEVFGPFVAIAKFKTQEEAIKRANKSSYGLAAKIESGMVWINSSNDSHFAVPFGGVKQSGIGRECGEYALANYTNAKAVHLNLGTML
ncbi:aldehyde dehydrogenase [Trichophaea hybrida]|nr:aldehyde dehydrogenase [Trichophaea hybrida]